MCGSMQTPQHSEGMKVKKTPDCFWIPIRTYFSDQNATHAYGKDKKKTQTHSPSVSKSWMPLQNSFAQVG